jgi:hypothetical protein
MPKANEKEKGFTILEKDLNVILAVNNPKLSPYLDVFRHYPENVSLQNLGILTGFFKINDLGDESAYIVNFLSSVLKKEYYANPKRAIESSFDSALRKVNLALSEIAKEGNVNWLGKIDGAVCVFEKNTLHFSVCGKAKVLLLRNQSISEISADMAPDFAEPNPLKTFIDVSSGRLEDGDKIIVCKEDIFKVFSEEEIKKGSVRFEREKFVQFIKTALTNKLEIVGTIIVDIFEKEEDSKPAPEPKSEIHNVFSKKVFEKKEDVSQKLSELLIQEEKKEYTDGKTGHIYIQEEKEGEFKKESPVQIYWVLAKEKIGDTFYWIKSRAKRKIALMGRSIAKTSQSFIAKAKLKLEERKKIRLEKKEQAEKYAAASAASSAAAKALADKKALADEEERNRISKESTFAKAQADKTEEIPAQPVFNEPFLARLAKRKAELEKEDEEKKKLSYNAEPSRNIMQSVTDGKIEAEKDIFAPFKKITPDFRKIKELLFSFSNKQKIYSAIAIFLIFVAPLVFLKLQSAMKTKQAPKQTEQKAPSARELFSREKNIIFLNSLEKLSAIRNPKVLLFLNEKIIAVSDSQLLVKDNNGSIKEIAWPENYGKATQASSMKDLNLALIYTDQNKMISFLSATSGFKENNISILENSKISGLGTYLTYAYLLDSENSQIYRYPRAEGGFGEKVDWYKDQAKLSNACCMSIDENVYLINEGKELKIFKGKIQDFNLEKTVNSFTPDKIFTDSDTQNLYVLDKNNGRVIKFSKDGALLAQYFHEDIKKAIDFVIDEKNSKAYIITSENLVSFDLQ